MKFSTNAHDYACLHAKLLRSCLTLCDPMDCSLPGFSLHGILQARILEWVAMPSSRGSSRPRDRTCISYLSCVWQAGSLPLAPPGKPFHNYGLTLFSGFSGQPISWHWTAGAWLLPLCSKHVRSSEHHILIQVSSNCCGFERCCHPWHSDCRMCLRAGTCGQHSAEGSFSTRHRWGS